MQQLNVNQMLEVKGGSIIFDPIPDVAQTVDSDKINQRQFRDLENSKVLWMVFGCFCSTFTRKFP